MARRKSSSCRTVQRKVRPAARKGTNKPVKVRAYSRRKPKC